MPFHIIRNLNRVEDHRYPEVGEKEDHSRIKNIVKRPCRQGCRDPIRCRRSRKKKTQNTGGKQQDRVRKNDRHDARIIHLQWQK